tara:strand:- start:60 stop:257 length:198 start_codon:yes stop_codon:yes gene_type:complete
MNDSNNLGENFKIKVNELKVLIDELENDLIEKIESIEESNELIEVLKKYKLQIYNLSNSTLNEEE